MKQLPESTLALYNNYKSMFASKGYEFYTEPNKLNIIGIRSEERQAGKFDDALVVIYTDTSKEIHAYVFPFTTDPGIPYLKKPIAMYKGVPATAILKAGQYIDTWSIGMHRGEYKALVQVKPVVVWRDSNRDTTLHMFVEQEGRFGINIHKRKGTDDNVRGASAGCQVFQLEEDFNTFMSLCRQHSKLHGNKFTYTLLET